MNEMSHTIQKMIVSNVTIIAIMIATKAPSSPYEIFLIFPSHSMQIGIPLTPGIVLNPNRHFYGLLVPQS